MAASLPTPPENTPPAGLVLLARRLTALTSNLLATGIVLVLALGGGRQLVRWYQEDPLPSDDAARQITSSGAPPEVELAGGGYALRRAGLRGPDHVAIARLEQFCRDTLQGPIPAENPVGESERRFLASLADHRPAAESPSEWRIYRFEGLMPMVVGVSDKPPLAPRSGPPLATSAGRVLAWGIAVPAGQNEWLLYQYKIASGDASGLSEGFPISLPDQAHRTLAVADGQQRTIGLTGAGSPDEWRRHFDQQFHQLGWTSEGWQAAGGGWHARYALAARQGAEVHFAHRGGGRLHGLVIFTGSADKQ